MRKKCYACDGLATGKEHCPPKCLFPEGHRKNLITVPACDSHNNAKSDNDEFFRLIVVGMAGKIELIPTIIRSVKRKKDTGELNKIQKHVKDILNQVAPSNLENISKLPNNNQYEPYDMAAEKADCFKKHLELTARGIMYHEKKFSIKMMYLLCKVIIYLHWKLIKKQKKFMI